MKRDLIIAQVFEQINSVDQSAQDAEAMIYTILDRQYEIWDVELAVDILLMWAEENENQE